MEIIYITFILLVSFYDFFVSILKPSHVIIDLYGFYVLFSWEQFGNANDVFCSAKLFAS